MSGFASSTTYEVGIAGATGAVGVEIVKCLHKKSFPVSRIHLFASARSAGKVLETDFGSITVEEFTIERARKCQIVFLAVSGEFAQVHAKYITADDGPIVIDNSSAFRYFPEVPLVVPEINPDDLKGGKLIANPNCTTAIAAVVLWPIHKVYKIKKIIMSTYQAASGAGAEGMEELLIGTQTHLQGEVPGNTVFVHPLPFNLIPHIDKFQENGYTKEEMKVVWETRKIFGIKDENELAISCTAVRVPVLRAHSEAITIVTEEPIDADAVRNLLIKAPGVHVTDYPRSNLYPMPITSSEEFDVEVGRIRNSLVFEPNGLDLFVCGDQLLRGAALNAVLIAEKMIEMGLIK